MPAQMKNNPVYRWKCLRIVARQHISVRRRAVEKHMHFALLLCRRDRE